jgi:hypothetical protein
LNESEAPDNLRQLGIEGYAVKANMTDDTVDQLVNNILRPETTATEADTSRA